MTEEFLNKVMHSSPPSFEVLLFGKQELYDSVILDDPRFYSQIENISNKLINYITSNVIMLFGGVASYRQSRMTLRRPCHRMCCLLRLVIAEYAIDPI